MSQKKDEQSPKQQKEEKPFGEPVTETDESESDEEEGGLKMKFATEEEATKGRKDGLAFYNKQNFEEAQHYQAACCEFWSRTKGDLSKESALALLDYGLTQLALLETRDAEQAALGTLVEGHEKDEMTQAYEECFETLQVAKLGWEKAEKANSKDQEIQQRLIEVHDALGSFHEESGDDEQAVQEYELVKAMNAALEKPSERREFVADYCIARCHAKAENWDAALEPAKNAMTKVQAATDVAPELVETIKATYEEVKEMVDRGGMEDIKEEIRAHFPDENSQVLDPEEALKEATNTNAFVTPLPSDLANHNKAVSNSIPAALIAPIAPKEGSNSVSFIQPLGGVVPGTPNPGAPRPVNVVAVRKKPKSQSNGGAPSAQASPEKQKRERSAEGPENSDAPPTKKARHE